MSSISGRIRRHDMKLVANNALLQIRLSIRVQGVFDIVALTIPDFVVAFGTVLVKVNNRRGLNFRVKLDDSLELSTLAVEVHFGDGSLSGFDV